MDSFSSYHINKGGNIHSFKIKSHRTTWVFAEFKQENDWKRGYNLEQLLKHLYSDHFQVNSGQVCHQWSDLKTILGGAVCCHCCVCILSVLASNNIFRSLLIFFCSCLIEASEVRCTLFSPFSFSVFLSHLRALCLPGIGEIACVPTASAAPQQVQAMCHHQKYSQAAPVSNSPASTASPTPSGAYTSPLALQLSWGQHEGMMIFISAIQTVRRQGVGRSLSWLRQVKARKVSRQQSQSIMFCEVSGIVSEHP